MSSDDKKIKITGEVKIDQSQASKDAQEFKKELDGFKTSFEKIGSGVELVLRALASMAQSMAKANEDVAKTASGTANIAEAVKEATAATQQQKAETDAVNKAVEKVTAEVALMRREQENAAAATELTLDALESMQRKLEDSSRQAKETALKSSDITEAVKQATAATQQMGKEQSNVAAVTAGIVPVVAAIDNAMDAASKEAKGVAAESSKITEATNQAADAAAKQKEEVEGVGDAVKSAVKNVEEINRQQEEASAKAGILNGFWERIGHTVIDIVSNGIKGVVQLLITGIGRAQDFNEIFDKMGARGVENVDAIKLAVTNLAGAMNEDLLEVARAVDFADSLGAGAESVDVARVAMENYRITGMDVNRQIEISSRLIKAYNSDVSAQADLIREVAQVSQTAHIRQEELWSGLTSVGPKIAKLGGSIKELVRITAAGLSSGIKSGDDGLQGMSELLNSLIKPGNDFGEMLIKTGLIATQTSPQWRALTATINEQKRSFEALNAQLKEYKSESSQIGLLATQTESLVKKYETLMAKKQSGVKLSYDEKKALLEVTRSLRENNEELSKYDKAGFIVENREFKRLGLIEQISERLQAAKQAQEDLNLKIQESELKSQGSGSAIQTLNMQLAAMAKTMGTEIPAAIQTAVANNGLDAFIQRIAATPAALAQLPSQVQTLVTSLAGIDMTASSAAQSVGDISMQAAALAAQGSGSITMMQNNFSTLATTLMGPVAESFGAVARIINDKLSEPFGDGSTILSKVSGWAADLGAEIITDLEDLTNGDTTVEDLFAKWIERAIEGMTAVAMALLKKFWESLVDDFKNGKPELEQALVKLFGNLAKSAAVAFKDSFVGLLDSIGQSMQNVFYTGLASTDQLAFDYQGVQPLTQNRSVNSNTTINVNGAGDPSAVATEVMKLQSQAERLGNSGARLR